MPRLQSTPFRADSPSWRRQTRTLLSAVGALSAFILVASMGGSAPEGIALAIATSISTWFVSREALKTMWGRPAIVTVVLAALYGTLNAFILLVVCLLGASVIGNVGDDWVGMLCGGLIACIIVGGGVGIVYGIAYATLLASVAGPTERVRAIYWNHPQEVFGPPNRPPLSPRNRLLSESALSRPLFIGLWLMGLSVLVGALPALDRESFLSAGPRIDQWIGWLLPITLALAAAERLSRAAWRFTRASTWVRQVQKHEVPGWRHENGRLNAEAIGSGPFREMQASRGVRISTPRWLAIRGAFAAAAALASVGWSVVLIAG